MQFAALTIIAIGIVGGPCGLRHLHGQHQPQPLTDLGTHDYVERYIYSPAGYLTEVVLNDSLRLRYQFDPGGNIVSSEIGQFTGVAVESASELPTEPKLYLGYPNPFYPSTTILFDVPTRSHVTLKIFDVLGRRVSKLIDSEYVPGRHSIVFDARNVASGTYFYEIGIGEYKNLKQLTVLR